jgi:phosphoglycolate phosphatase
LLDTAADIALALNRALTEYGWEVIPESAVRLMIGRGGQVLVERAAQLQRRTLGEAQLTGIVDRFYEHYGELEARNEAVAQPYAGAVKTLQRLKAAGLRSAVVTNKLHRFAVELFDRLQLSDSIDLIVGGDTCERRKPDPQPLLHACTTLGLAPSETLMVGDSINDVLAARAAAIPVVCVTYGYNEGQDPRSLPCDGWIDTLDELPALILPQSS